MYHILSFEGPRASGQSSEVWSGDKPQDWHDELARLIAESGQAHSVECREGGSSVVLMVREVPQEEQQAPAEDFADAEIVDVTDRSPAPQVD